MTHQVSLTLPVLALLLAILTPPDAVAAAEVMMRHIRRGLSVSMVLVLSALALACGRDDDVAGPITVTRTSVAPAATDSAIDDPVGGDHVVLVPSVAARSELFVHLPGTGGVPQASAAFLDVFAQEMKVIGLQYVNDGPVNGICAGDSDPRCTENLRLERTYGIDSSPFEDVNEANSVVFRLVRLLEWLEREQPGLGWQDYLEQGEPRWDRIVLSGHSQGSGMAALIARDHEVARVLMFGGPTDFGPDIRTASWMTDSKVTPIDRYFGFRHVDDPLFIIKGTWADMGLPGPPVVVDESMPPYDGSHFLETNVDVDRDRRHRSVIDGRLLDPDEQPMFTPTWLYMCCS